MIPANINGQYVETVNHILKRFKYLRYLSFPLFYGMWTFIGQKCFLHSVHLLLQLCSILLLELDF